jgi:hypothetical protein
MLKKILTVVLPLLLPFLIYAAYVVLARRKALLAGEGRLPRWQEAPWALIVASGVGLMVAVLIGMRLLSGAEPGATITPPRLIDGEVVPSQVQD